MIKRILIANRGEIVNRIIRTCEKLGIETVVVYTDADKDNSYVEKATQSIYIGPSIPIKSYLNIDVLVEAVKKSGAEAVHPGYGFLSESAAFAKAVETIGAKWIGPDIEILENIESKCYCRQIASKVGVPITPGTIEPITSTDEVINIADKVGLPIILKLDKGGGGKGIEKVDTIDSMETLNSTLESMKRIGKMAFASEDIYVEKAVISPKHIEVQFIADASGKVVCLGERECSIQRRYQKVIEEAPSMVVTNEERKKLYDYTKKLISEMKYTGAGTVEFLRNKEGDFYFMEINARLQVEHPVSEYVTGVDLVEQQIRIASGEKILFGQDDVQINGHAIECRIYSEDPETFMPCPGKISKLQFPDSGKYTIRIEHAINEGYQITPYYDSMLCKLIAWGENRKMCIETMKGALNDFKIEGVPTTIQRNLNILQQESFVTGKFDTSFVIE